jgi:multidrug efflux pump subunit AcrA (membrane-fusion protein)
VEPAGRVKIVNHPRGGRVAAIHVREGQRVEAGATLVTLDGEIARSERSELLGRLQLRLVEVARLEAEASGRELKRDSADLRPDLLATQEALLEARNAAHASRRNALEKSVQARQGEMRSAAAEVDRLRNSLELLGSSGRR